MPPGLTPGGVTDHKPLGDEAYEFSDAGKVRQVSIEAGNWYTLVKREGIVTRSKISMGIICMDDFKWFFPAQKHRATNQGQTT